MVARLGPGAYSWSPDSAHLLVSVYGKNSEVFDRAGKAAGTFGATVGWLDAGHLINEFGRVDSLAAPELSEPGDNSWVFANGHGSAAIIVAVPGCDGDPQVVWYRDGSLGVARETVKPFGWSVDGRLALLGHYSCDHPELAGWQGRVDVVDFATRQTLVGAGGVTGKMALNPAATRLAAQSGTNVKVVDVADGPSMTIADAVFLGWRDSEHLYLKTGAKDEIRLVDVSGGRTQAGTAAGAWLIPSNAGPFVEADASGAVRRIVGSDGATTLLDLSGESLVADSALTSAPDYARNWAGPWSPDGRMLVLESHGGTALYLFSVDPAPPAA